MDDFARRHARARTSLGAWKKVVEAASWKSLVELRATFPSADLVDKDVVFNIGGNNYRLWEAVDFKTKIVLVTSIQTRAEYSRER